MFFTCRRRAEVVMATDGGADTEGEEARSTGEGTDGEKGAESKWERRRWTYGAGISVGTGRCCGTQEPGRDVG